MNRRNITQEFANNTAKLCIILLSLNPPHPHRELKVVYHEDGFIGEEEEEEEEHYIKREKGIGVHRTTVLFNCFDIRVKIKINEMIRSYSPERQANITREASKIELYSEISESDEDAGYPMFGGTDISIPAIIEFFKTISMYPDGQYIFEDDHENVDEKIRTWIKTQKENKYRTCPPVMEVQGAVQSAARAESYESAAPPVIKSAAPSHKSLMQRRAAAVEAALKNIAPPPPHQSPMQRQAAAQSDQEKDDAEFARLMQQQEDEYLARQLQDEEYGGRRIRRKTKQTKRKKTKQQTRRK